MADEKITQPPATSEAANQTQTITAQAPATEQPAADPDSRRVRIVRVDRDDGPAICVPYDDKTNRQQHWYPEPEKNEFEVPAVIAYAAVASGFFIEAASSKTKLKINQS